MGGKLKKVKKKSNPIKNKLKDKRKIKNVRNIKRKIKRKQKVKGEYQRQIPKKIETATSSYRYSIAYDSGRYGKTFRAEVYTRDQKDERRMKTYLDNALFNHMTKTNKGLFAMYRTSSYVGFEAEQVGKNDKGYLNYNRIYYEIG